MRIPAPGQDRLLSARGSPHPELIRRLAVELPTVADRVTRLEPAGFVRWGPDPAHRRISRLLLTAEGRCGRGAVRAVRRDVEGLVLAPLAARRRAWPRAPAVPRGRSTRSASVSR